MTDLQRLLPPSISQDAGIQAAARAAGAQESLVRGLIPRAYIWSRLEELPDEVLEHLGWGLHIDGWEYAITRQSRLWLIRHFYEWHVHKGTEHGLALYWRTLLGRRLLKADPPGKSYLGGSLSDEERRVFEAAHPEIRAYPFRTRAAGPGLVMGDCLGDPARDWPATPVHSDALLRCGQRLELVDPDTGSAAPLGPMLYQRGQAERLARGVVEVRLPGRGAPGQFLGRPLARPLVDHGAAGRLFTLRLERAHASEVERRISLAARPGLRPMSVYYSWVQEPTTAPGGVFLAGRWPDRYPDTGGRAFLGAAWPAPTDAGMRLYKRFRLFDPQRVHLAARESSLFLGAFRLGPLPPHTAEVALDMIEPRLPGALYCRGYLGTGHHFVVSDAEARVAQACQVGRLAARRSDKILLSITNRRPVRASAGVLAGAVTAGDYRLEVI